MNKRRISTNISQKHWELLLEYVDKLGTQERVLELALESLRDSSKQNRASLTREEIAWMKLKKEKRVCVVDKSAFKLLIQKANIESFYEYFIQNKLIESRIELLFQKPIKELNLEELVIGIVSASKLTNWIDTVEYTDNDTHHSVLMSHSLGSEISKVISDSYRNMFNSKSNMVEIAYSTNNIFIKIFKD